MYGQTTPVTPMPSTNTKAVSNPTKYDECMKENGNADLIVAKYCRCEFVDNKPDCKEQQSLELCKRDRFANTTNPEEIKLCSCIAYGGIELNTDVPFIGRCIAKSDTSKSVPLVVG